ncbi:conserved hypothetical protein [Talaromyces stipitatus ATCC 10500]|uniref:Uncharacterized protein n=1 Tax=Talaromyces stipitatus (strain ATCC 10500 / CBS 375.48 / QM 6759 / NRRL 1006) TaxID=441959 RepID=B8LVT4_TALSN|nr:uncharacterized protein TSTA_075860 [Talaromyces stipitatus ATCC 10500]EED24214.1 conserved hypothetical protein [Talaromyces stipitatus ATCC 10500]
MSLLDQRRRSTTGKSPSTSPASSPFFQRTRGVSPTRRTSSRRLSARTPDTAPPLRHSSSRKISRNNPPHVNNDIAKSHIAIMNSRPHTPVHQDFATSTDSATTLVNPTSTILQGLIKEQRAARGSRKTPQLSEDADHRPPTAGSNSQSHESPSEKQRRINSFASSGLKQPRDMGIREMDQYVSKMNKLNFDLKLEIFHRTQQIASLEKKMERMYEMEEELKRMHGLENELNELREVEEINQRLREDNEKLQSDLDERDHALSEAARMIAVYEEKVKELEAGRLLGDGFADDVSEAHTPTAQSFVDIPDRTSSRRGTVRRPHKSSSFLREENRSTATLRGLFIAEENKSVRSVSESTLGTTVDSMADPPSPRLSILSECSYFSPQDMLPQGTGFDQLDRLDQLTIVGNDKTPVVTAPKTESSKDHLSDRISDWMQFDELASRRKSNDGNRHRARAFSDISRSSHVQITHLDEPFQPMRKTRHSQYPSPRQEHLATFGGNLPPTPDTMSTFRPAFRNGSNTSLPKGRLVGGDATFPPLSRPRSVGELTTRSASRSVQSDGIDTTASIDTQRNVQNSPTNLLSFSHYGRGSAKANRVLGPGSPSDPRLSCYGGDLLFNGDGVESLISDMPVARTLSFKSKIPVKSSNELLSSLALTPQDWLEAAKAEDETNEAEKSNAKPEAEEKPSILVVENDETPPTNTEESSIQLRNPPLRLRAWANESSPVTEAHQHRRRLSLRPPFFSRNRQQQETGPVAASSKGPSPLPDKLLVLKHRRTSSGPGLNSNEGTSRASSRPLPKPFSDVRPSTASRPMTSDSAEPRSKGSFLLGWMKGGSHNKESESTNRLGLARPTTERPRSFASIDITYLNLGQNGESAALEEEPVWRARRRSRRMV